MENSTWQSRIFIGLIRLKRNEKKVLAHGDPHSHGFGADAAATKKTRCPGLHTMAVSPYQALSTYMIEETVT